MISRDPEMVSGMINNNPEKTMKKVFFYIAVFAAMVSCAKVETPTQEEQGSKLNIITATVKNDATKVAISTSDYTLFDHLWQTGDQVSVIDGTNKLYTLATGNGERTATFSGESALSGTTPYYAIYPYDIAATLDGSTITTTFPATQTYTPGSYDKAALVMIGKGEDADNFGFKLASSIIQITLTPSTSYTVKKVEITANGGESIAGEAEVNYNDGTPIVTMTDGVPTVTVDFGAGVVLTAKTSYTFYVALPAVTLSSGVSVAVTDSDNNLLLKKSSSLSLTRNYVTKMPALTAVPNIPNLALVNSASVGLATPQTANCYVVNAAADASYAIPIDTKGNSSEISLKGINASELLWDDGDIITNDAFRVYGKYLVFKTNANYGNALIAAKIGSTIQWSWHIWSTNYDLADTDDFTYSDKVYKFMPIHLGELPTPPTRGDYTERGCMYQWGRKDPITLNSYVVLGTGNTMTETVEWSIQNPTAFDRSWISASSMSAHPENKALWSTDVSYGEHGVEKTIYDPSPVGYNVMSYDDAKAFIAAVGASKTTYLPSAISGVNKVPGNHTENLYTWYVSHTALYDDNSDCYAVRSAGSSTPVINNTMNAVTLRPVRSTY